MNNTKNLIIVNIFLAGALITLSITSFRGSGESKPTGTPILGNAPDQTIKTINLNRKFDFCGEDFPMDNWDVRQRLDRELMASVYGHSQTLLGIKRAAAYFPLIEPILQSEGVPDDIKYVAVAESVLSNAVSPVGAKGVWQFMKETGLSYGLEINGEVDERYHLEKATKAACKYLKGEHDRLGSWVLSAAAYNGGPGRIATEKATQRANNFFEMNLAAEETMRYPFRIVAIKEVMKSPDLYEYLIDNDHLYGSLDNFTTVQVSDAVENWGDFAKQHGTNYRMLKLFNPWLIDSKLTNKTKKTYSIKIPK
jgi:membrane-bound lytic murein transglycosylase D